MPKPPSPYTVKEARETLAAKLAEAPDNWVMCRDVMHAWQVLNNFHVTRMVTEKRSKTMMIARELVCMRCGTVKKEHYIMRRDGILERIGHPSYAYPQGYQIAGIPRGVKPKALVQQEQYRRAMEDAAKAAAGERDAPEN